jgi:predicted anti-sigma-YlaC factor YlaD
MVMTAGMRPSTRFGRRGGRFLWPLLLLPALGGCSLKTMAVKTVANTLSETGDVFSRDDDPELIRDAVPFALKLQESLLESVPKHRPLLVATCSGFTQYAYAFVQGDVDQLESNEYDTIAALNDRAFRLYLRARGYCLRALEIRRRGVERALQTTPESALGWATAEDVPLLYWTAASWGAAIALGLDKPGLILDVPAVRALADRALALDEDFQQGALHAMMIALEARPEMGGSRDAARRHFDRAVELSQGLDPGPFVSYAASVSLADRNRAEFVKLLEAAVAIDPEKQPSNRLAILIGQKRARRLLERIDELFSSGGLRPAGWPVTFREKP